MGDIIVIDRQLNRTDSPSNTWVFDDLQMIQGDMRSDIVVEIDTSASPPFVETLGGNLVQRLRRKRYPLQADGKLIVDRSDDFVVQQDDGSFPPLPSPGSATGFLDDRSSRLIFAVLGPAAGDT